VLTHQRFLITAKSLCFHLGIAFKSDLPGLTLPTPESSKFGPS